MLIVINNLPWFGSEGVTVGWLNSYRVQIVPFIADGLIFLFVQFFKDLPRELNEACRVEGATWFQISWRVVMPLSGPVIATAAILRIPLHVQPVPVAADGDPGGGVPPGHGRPAVLLPAQHRLGELMAYLSVITVPVLAFYLILQRAFVSSIASTGVKG